MVLWGQLVLGMRGDGGPLLRVLVQVDVEVGVAVGAGRGPILSRVA